MAHHRLIILGSGPAGSAAAVYAARAGLHPVIIHGPQAGGQLTTTTDVDNWIGAAEGVQGPDLMTQMHKHAERFGTRYIADSVDSVDFSKRPLILFGNQARYSCDALIIATGASARYLGLDSEMRFKNRGVSACATCDGFFFRNQDVAVIGGGNTAVEEALYLSNICRSVVLVHRRDSLRAERILQDTLFEKVHSGKIKLMFNHQLIEILGDNVVSAMRLQPNAQPDNIQTMPIDGIFIAIGHTPNSQPFINQITTNNGYIEIHGGQTGMATATNVTGVFAAGDIADSIYRQAITSAGFGCMAALDAEKYLATLS